MAAIDNSDLDEKIKAEKRKQLAAESQLTQTQLDRAYENPLQSYARDVAKTGNNLNDSFGAIAVDGLESLNDGITEAIMGAKNLGDVFSNVSKQIIADLIRIAVQQMIIKPLLASLGGGQSGGMSGVFQGLISGKRAMGGPVSGGKTYLVGERGPELFTAPNGGGKIIPNHTLMQSGGSSSMQQIIQVDARGAVMNDQFASMILGQAKQYAASAGAQAVKVAGQQAPAMVAKQQRFGA
jgi:hypothetical protein